MICSCPSPTCRDCGCKVGRKPKAPEKRLRTKAQDREIRREWLRMQTASIREAVFKRAAGRCEAVWFGTGPCLQAPTEWHHLLGGSGRRTQKQSVETTRAFCMDCHRRSHRGDKGMIK